MAFDVGGSKEGVRPSINVTPLVDVVLVLLIIFMVITPLLSKQFYLHTAKKDENKDPPAQNDPKPPVVLTARAGGAYLNADKIPLEELGDKLRRVFAARNEYMLFFAAEDDVPFGEAMKIMDAARGGGALTIAVVTDPPKPSP
ncbi:MAG: Biopolymer transport protein ExbD [Myxococcota bacterium]|nr:Biopolymer transport protein ExbD [Myxococcota bacterium]